MRKMVLAASLALASTLVLSACGVLVDDGGSRGADGSDRPIASDGSQGGRAVDRNDSGEADGVAGGVVPDEPVQQPGESDSSFATRVEQFGSVSSGSQFPYECNDGPWSSTGDHQKVVLHGHCTDVNVTHGHVKVWVAQADRVNVGTGGMHSRVVANEVSSLTIAAGHVHVYTGTLGDVTVAPADAANHAKVYTGTIGPRVTIQADHAGVYYDQGSPSVTNTGSHTNVKKN
ncbi:MAG: hypothetical protein FWH11_12675 [Micrococcales bacterium]|nr:hypothetical protein [Micrococcales bacterium]